MPARTARVVRLQPSREGTDVIELGVLGADVEKRADVVFAHDRKDCTILSVRDQNTFDDSLRRRAVRGPVPRRELATDALDEVRREARNHARRHGAMQLARDLNGARFAVWKNPENLTDRQQAKLATIQKANARLYRAYLLKGQPRQIYRVGAAHAEHLLDRWLTWADDPGYLRS
jgi:hypothetical protein